MEPCRDCAVLALAIDPVNPTTVYAGERGVYKSGNGGATWITLNTGLIDTYVDTLAIDPTTPTTLYVGLARACLRPPTAATRGAPSIPA